MADILRVQSEMLGNGSTVTVNSALITTNANIVSATITNLAYNGIIPTTNYSSFNTCMAAAAPYGNTVLVCSNTSLTANVIVPANVKLIFADNGSINIPTGMLVYLIGRVDAPLEQIFTGNGNVWFHSSHTSPYIYPEWFGAKADGSTDCSPAINKALNARRFPQSTGQAFVKLHPGVYNCNSTININYDGTVFEGSGKRMTFLQYNPTANDRPCVDIRSWQSIAALGGNTVAITSQQQIFHVTVRDFQITSTDTAYRKIGMQTFNLGTCDFSNIVIRASTIPTGDDGQRFGTANTHDSIGLLSQGRDACSFRDFNIAADYPIVIEQNPTATRTIVEDADHFNFHNMYLQPYGSKSANSGNPSIYFKDGVNISNMSWTGYQAYVGGSHGVYWYDTTSSVSSYAICFENARIEQTVDSNSWMFFISHNTTINGLRFRGIYGGTGANACTSVGFSTNRHNGYYVRGSYNVTFEDCTYTNGGTKKTASAANWVDPLDASVIQGMGINVDHTVRMVESRNCFWQQSTATLHPGVSPIFRTPQDPRTADVALAPTFHWANNTTSYQNFYFGNNVGVQGDGYTVLKRDNSINPGTGGGNVMIGTSTTSGFLFIHTGANRHALFYLTGTAGQSLELFDPDNVYGNTNNATNYNVYVDSANGSVYMFQNHTTSNINVRFLLLGTRVTSSNVP